jgi:hypothetical protein
MHLRLSLLTVFVLCLLIMTETHFMRSLAVGDVNWFVQNKVPNIRNSVRSLQCQDMMLSDFKVLPLCL